MADYINIHVKYFKIVALIRICNIRQTWTFHTYNYWLIWRVTVEVLSDALLRTQTINIIWCILNLRSLISVFAVARRQWRGGFKHLDDLQISDIKPLNDLYDKGFDVDQRLNPEFSQAFLNLHFARVLLSVLLRSKQNMFTGQTSLFSDPIPSVSSAVFHGRVWYI